MESGFPGGNGELLQRSGLPFSLLHARLALLLSASSLQLGLCEASPECLQKLTPPQPPQL